MLFLEVVGEDDEGEFLLSDMVHGFEESAFEEVDFVGFGEYFVELVSEFFTGGSFAFEFVGDPGEDAFDPVGGERVVGLEGCAGEAVVAVSGVGRVFVLVEIVLVVGLVDVLVLGRDVVGLLWYGGRVGSEGGRVEVELGCLLNEGWGT